MKFILLTALFVVVVLLLCSLWIVPRSHSEAFAPAPAAAAAAAATAHYCSTFTNEFTTGEELLSMAPDTPVKTLADAKRVCSANDACSFFTCDPSRTTGSGRGTPRCKQFQWFGQSPDPSDPSSNRPLAFPFPKEKHTKSPHSCPTTVSGLPTCQKERMQMKTKAYSRHRGGGLARFDMPKTILSTPVTTTAFCADGNDQNCFLNPDIYDAASQRSSEFDYALHHFNTKHTDPHNADVVSENKYAFYKDVDHEVYVKNTNSCCYDSVQASRDAVAANRCAPGQIVDAGSTCNEVLPDETVASSFPGHPQANNTSVFTRNAECAESAGQRRSAPSRYVYRKDLNACVPNGDQCAHPNAAVCEVGSPFFEDFQKKCPFACDSMKCSVPDAPGVVHACPGNRQPHYTHLGTYNTIIHVRNALTVLHAKLKKQSPDTTYRIVDPSNTSAGEYIRSAKDVDIKGKRITVVSPRQRKESRVYHIVALSHCMGYIEMYPETETIEQTRWYMVDQQQTTTPAASDDSSK
jgi:hypothetical protein